jgi:hypothetical protein
MRGVGEGRGGKFPHLGKAASSGGFFTPAVIWEFVLAGTFIEFWPHEIAPNHKRNTHLAMIAFKINRMASGHLLKRIMVLFC